MGDYVDYVGVALIGLIVGLSELASRYRDEPGNVMKTLPGLLYLLLNMSLALAALALIRGFGWTFNSADAADVSSRLTQVLVAGFGAMTLFRSSLFTVRIGTQDIGVGPSSVLQVFLTAVDRAVDRKRAAQRDRIISEVMPSVSFFKAQGPLPARCFALLQNPSAEDQAIFARQVEELRKLDVSDHVKASLLGLALMNQVGENVLKAAVTALGDEIKDDAEERNQAFNELISDVSFIKARETLPAYCIALAQNFSAEKQADLTRQVGELDKISMDDRVKARLLGLALLNAVGEDVFKAAITALGDEIKDDLTEHMSPVSPSGEDDEMVQIEQTVEINQPVEKVFNYVADIERMPEWAGAVITVEKSQPGPLQEGANFKLISKFLGRQYETPYEVISDEQNQCLAFRSTGGPVFQEWSLGFDSAPDGTHFTQILKVKPGDFFELARQPFQAAGRRQATADLATLRDLLEHR